MKRVLYASLCLIVLLSAVLILLRGRGPAEPVPALSDTVPSAGERYVEEVLQAVPVVRAGDAESPIWNSRTPAAHRARIVHPNPAILSPRPVLQQGDALQVAFFEDAVVSSRIRDVTVYPNGAVGMTALMEGDYRGYLYLACSGGELRIHADVLGGNDFYLRYDRELEAHVAIEVDRENSDIQDCAVCRAEREQAPGEAVGEAVRKSDPVESQPLADTVSPGTVGYCSVMTYENFDNDYSNGYEYERVPHFSNPEITFTGLNSINPTGHATSGDNARVLREMRSVLSYYRASGNEGAGDPVNIDVMIVYTPAALAAEGGSTNAMNNNIALAMQKANTTHGNSDTRISLNLVHSAEVSYTEVDYLSDLDSLTLVDGVMDEVHTWRDTYGADFVCLFEDDPGTGGVGWLLTASGGRPERAFCLARVQQTDTGYTVVHEWGHNMGCSHSKTQAIQPWETGDFSSYSAGWQWPDTPIDDGPVSIYPSISSFESTYLPWSYDTGELVWSRHSGSTGSTGTGPSYAYEGSYYIYTESSGNLNMWAILEARFDFSSLTDPSISYAYHMYGTSMGSMFLEASSDEGSTWDQLWGSGGNQLDQWHTNQISLAEYAGETNVIIRFKGLTGSSYTSDMALDNIVVAGETVNNDIDGDGIPNEWETFYFGGPTNANPTGNGDGDNYNNLAEYIAGLNPTVSDGLWLYGLDTAGQNTMSWNAASGRIYKVYWTDNLLSGFTLLQGNITSGVFTDAVHSAGSTGYYKLQVEVAP